VGGADSGTLRQACLAQESRIAQKQPDLPGVAITALSVSNSAFLGPIQVEFNLQYNALIGGRGTGKSTILEYLRRALCDQLPSSAADDELPNYQLRRKTLIEKTLQTVSGTVQVSFTVNGILHVVRRNSKTDGLQLKVGEADFATCREGDIRTLLPVQAYSQKQLSNVSVRLEELSRFVEAPIRGTLDDIEKIFDRAAAEMRQLYATLLRKRRLQGQIAEEELLLESLNEQAANMRSSLSGLSAEDTELLAAKPSYERAEEALETWTSDVQAIGGAIEEVDQAISGLPTMPAASAELPESVTLAEIARETTKYIAATKAAVREMKRQQAAVVSDDGAFKGTIGDNLKKWNRALEAYNEKYAEAKGRAGAHESRLEQLAQIEKRIADLRNSIASTRRELGGLGKPEALYERVRETWINAKAKRAYSIQQECEKLTTRSQGEIRASVRIGAGVDSVLKNLQTAVAGSGLRREKIDAVAEIDHGPHRGPADPYGRTRPHPLS